jgi:hypothetical protein
MKSNERRITPIGAYLQEIKRLKKKGRNKEARK